jgi:hypothetical protein
MATQVLKEYDAKLDTKRRCVIHGLRSFNRYHVRVYADGTVQMQPRVLASPQELSANTLRMLYGSIKNLKKGKAGAAVDFAKYAKYLTEDERE